MELMTRFGGEREREELMEYPRRKKTRRSSVHRDLLLLGQFLGGFFSLFVKNHFS